MAGLQDIVAADRKAGVQRTDRMRFLAAKASIELADPIRRRFEVLKLTQPLAKSIKLKKTLMEDAIAAYAEAAQYGVAEITTAAAYQLGQVYEVFGADLMDSERPRDLDAEALDQYDLLLEEQAFPFEEKAIELYKTNTDRVVDGVFDEWVQKSFARLAGLMPARYAKPTASSDGRAPRRGSPHRPDARRDDCVALSAHRCSPVSVGSTRSVRASWRRRRSRFRPRRSGSRNEAG